jgi:hypothetical protein
VGVGHVEAQCRCTGSFGQRRLLMESVAETQLIRRQAEIATQDIPEQPARDDELYPVSLKAEPVGAGTLVCAERLPVTFNLRSGYVEPGARGLRRRESVRRNRPCGRRRVQYSPSGLPPQFTHYCGWHVAEPPSVRRAIRPADDALRRPQTGLTIHLLVLTKRTSRPYIHGDRRPSGICASRPDVDTAGTLHRATIAMR